MTFNYPLYCGFEVSEDECLDIWETELKSNK